MRIIFILLFILAGYTTFAEDLFLKQYPREDRQIIIDVSREYNIPIKYLSRLHKLESQYNGDAIRYENNGTQSIGYSQINTVNTEYFADKFNNGIPIDLYDKETNIKMGAAYLRHLNDRLNGNWFDTFACYNFGIGNFLNGKKIPQSTLEYTLLILYGTDYMPYVEILTGAMEGLI